MSELMNAPAKSSSFRWRLLATVSGLTLVCAGVWSETEASDSTPTVWVELGGQLERQAIEPSFAPDFLSGPRPDFENPSPLEAQRSPRYSHGLEGALSFQPKDSDWIFSASIRYGRSNGNKRVHQSGEHFHFTVGTVTQSASALQFADTTSRHNESHAVLDFLVGKDVGLGAFGHNSTSQIEVGVRFAQFDSKSSVDISSDPDIVIQYATFGPYRIPLKYHHTYTAGMTAARSFHGVGPSLSWNSAIPVAGDSGDSVLTIDFGLNGAVLFGRQKSAIHQFTHGEYFHPKYQISGQDPHEVISDNRPPDQVRSRAVTVPNIGGFAGLSLRYTNAKISFGYRGEIFFNAMDDGFEAAHSGDRSFHGPFATISIGLGG